MEHKYILKEEQPQKNLLVSAKDKDTITKKGSVIYCFRCDKIDCKDEYRWVPLKPDFLGAWKSVWLKSNAAYPVIFSLVYMEKLPWQKF